MGDVVRAACRSAESESRNLKRSYKMPPPEDKKALQRALGMIAYQMRFCSKFSEVTAPLRQRLHDGNEFRWDARHTAAFDQMKAVLASAPVLAYFSPRHKNIVCQCDASQHGLGAVIMQNGKSLNMCHVLSPRQKLSVHR